MAEHAWTILCAAVTTDPETENISLHNVIDAISVHHAATTDPLVVEAGWHLVTLWRRTDLAQAETVVQRVTVEHPNGTRGAPNDVRVALEPSLRARSIALIPQFTLSGPGTYRFIVEHRSELSGDWIPDASLPVDINFGGPPPRS